MPYIDIVQLEDALVCDLSVSHLVDVLINRIKETNGLEFVDKLDLIRLNCLVGNEILDRE
jgi:hypothetical protein